VLGTTYSKVISASVLDVCCRCTSHVTILPKSAVVGVRQPSAALAQ